MLEKKHLQKTYQLSEHDATTISTNLLPITQSEKSVFRKEEKAKKVVSTSLHFPLWLLIVLLFAIERFWAEGKYRKKSKK